LVAYSRHEFGPFLLHRPIFAVPILGYLLGLPGEGLRIGVLFEYLYLDRIPGGGLRIPAVGVGGVTTLLFTFFLQQNGGEGSLLNLGFLHGWLGMLLFVPLDGFLRRVGNFLSDSTLYTFFHYGKWIPLFLQGYLESFSRFLFWWLFFTLFLYSGRVLADSILSTPWGVQIVSISMPWGWIGMGGIGIYLLRQFPIWKTHLRWVGKQ